MGKLDNQKDREMSNQQLFVAWEAYLQKLIYKMGNSIEAGNTQAVWKINEAMIQAERMIDALKPLCPEESSEVDEDDFTEEVLSWGDSFSTQVNDQMEAAL